MQLGYSHASWTRSSEWVNTVFVDQLRTDSIRQSQRQQGGGGVEKMGFEGDDLVFRGMAREVQGVAGATCF